MDNVSAKTPYYTRDGDRAMAMFEGGVSIYGHGYVAEKKQVGEEKQLEERVAQVPQAQASSTRNEAVTVSAWKCS